jgi:hypothetical protein
VTEPQTSGVVASLRALLEGPPPPVPVEHRTVRAAPALAIAERVTMAELEGWWAEAFEELHAAAGAAGVTPGVGGGLYPGELFEVEVADIVAFQPVPGDVRGTGRVRLVEIPAAELAVAVCWPIFRT